MVPEPAPVYADDCALGVAFLHQESSSQEIPSGKEYSQTFALSEHSSYRCAFGVEVRSHAQVQHSIPGSCVG